MTMIAVELAYIWALLLGDYPFDNFAKVGLPIDIMGAVGLVMFGFQIDLPWQNFWAVFQLAYAARFVTELWRTATDFSDEPAVPVVLGFAMISILGTFTWLALYRLGGSPFGTIPIL